MKCKHLFLLLLSINTAVSCKKSNNPGPPSTVNLNFTVDGSYNGSLNYTNVKTSPTITFTFSGPIQTSNLSAAITFLGSNGAVVPYKQTLQSNNSVLIIQPINSLATFSRYSLNVSPNLQSSSGGSLTNPVTISLITGVDSTNKFPLITDSQLLDLVQKQTLKYFWDYGHPVCGMARERDNDNKPDVIAVGGSGFGIMAIVTGVSRNFISHADGLARMQKIVGFLKNNAQTFHGAFPHWLNGTTGAAIAFSAQDDAADLVETSYLMEGLLVARQYFNGAGTDESALRTDINTLWNNVEWDWFRQNGQNTLYWHWSPNFGWSTNFQINGWDEALITYVMAASSNTHSIPKIVYDNGWANNGGIKNGNSYFGIKLPLGPSVGGPMFFAHYSFLGINPSNLSDAYASYDVQNKAHAMINYSYCVSNPNNFIGYGASCWGLTACDIQNGYTACSPTNDVGVIAPTAALSDMPYTPTQSMAALRFFYYKLGDKIWGQYGFCDSFNLNTSWVASSHLAIDQGPIIDMIENYRSGLLWNLFMSCPEVKTGMKNLGFQSPNL